MDNFIVPPRGLASNLGTLYVTRLNNMRGDLTLSPTDGIIIGSAGLDNITIGLANKVVRNDAEASFSSKVTLSNVVVPLTVPAIPTNGNLYWEGSSSRLRLYYNSSWITINASGGQIGGTLTGSPNTKSILYVGNGGVLAQSTTFVIDTSSGVKIGVGTTNPATNVDVVGTIRSSTLRATDLASATTAGANIVTSNGSGTLIAATPTSVVGAVAVLKGNNTGPITINSSTTLALTTGGLLGIHIDTSGNIGVGTTTIPEKLTVLGNVQASQFIVNNIPSTEKGEDLVISGSSKRITCKSQMDFPNIETTLTTENYIVDPTGRVVIQLKAGSPWLNTDRMELMANKGRHAQILVLQWSGSVAATAPILESSANLKLTAAWQPTQNDVLTLIHISTAANTVGVWYELSRSTL